MSNGSSLGGEGMQLYPCHNGAAQSFYLPLPVTFPLGMAIWTECSNKQMVVMAPRPLNTYPRVLKQNLFFNQSNEKWRFFDARTRQELALGV